MVGYYLLCHWRIHSLQVCKRTRLSGDSKIAKIKIDLNVSLGSRQTPEKTVSKSLPILKAMALLAVVVGAVGSLGWMFYAGRRNPSLFLMALFTGWVLSPFVALWVATVYSKRWSSLTRVALYSLMLLIPMGSLIVYSGALSPPGTKPAFVFLVIPLLSWLLMTTVIPSVEFLVRRRSDSK